MALTCFKGGTECGNNQVKNRIYSTPAVKDQTNLIKVKHEMDVESFQRTQIIEMEQRKYRYLSNYLF